MKKYIKSSQTEYELDTLNDVCRCKFGEGLEDFMMEFN